MKITPLCLILCCGSILLLPGAASAKPEMAKKLPYKLNISLPPGFAADDDPIMAQGATYVFDRENGDMGTKATLRFLKHPSLPQPPAQSDRAAMLDSVMAGMRGSHGGYEESPSYEVEAKQTTYTCADWHGSIFNNDFAGFVCVASFDGKTVLVEAEDLASNAGTTLPQLKDSLKAATYAKG